MSRHRFALLAVVLGLSSMGAARVRALPQGDGVARDSVVRGYYRFPSLHGDTVVFSAEGDLWLVGPRGGVARRLTTHPAEETHPVISPDGRTIAFTASYEGPQEVYTMPIGGGLPTRLTYDGAGATVVGWMPDGRVLYVTRRYATLPNTQLVALDPACATGGSCPAARQLIPLAQASDGVYAPDGTFYFTRLAFQGSYTKRYRGGTAQNLWKWDPRGGPAPAVAVASGPHTISAHAAEIAVGDAAGGEATPLTSDYPGTSKAPMWWQGRIYFASDRDGVMNLWSMDPAGGDLKQLTHHTDYDVQSPALNDGRIIYQSGADLWLFDIASGQTQRIPVSLSSDFDQLREKWVENPMSYLTSVHVAPNGDRVVLTSRGHVFVAPVGPGRFVQVTLEPGVRYRDGRFLPDGKRLLALSDESGEVELWTLPANGVGKREQLTRDAKILRWEGIPSPDGRWIAHHDKNQNLYLYDVTKKTSQQIASSTRESAWISSAPGYSDIAWSPDGRWLAYNDIAPDFLGRVMLYDTQTGTHTAVTTDRYDSYSPTWSPDGKWLWLLSDRTFRSTVGSPWGARQPDPHFTKETRIYGIALQRGLRSPFQPGDELTSDTTRRAGPNSNRNASSRASGRGGTDSTRVEIDLEGIQTRLFDVPVAPGNYGSLSTDGKRLYWQSYADGAFQGANLMSIEITAKDPKPAAVMEGIRNYELSLDRKKLMVRKGTEIFVFDAGAKAPQKLDDSKVDLSGWRFPIDPREEWRHNFVDAWRLERDYFYDPNMHGVDWPAMRVKYQPLASRVTTRAELNDVLAQMVGELSALHIFVRGGDQRTGDEQIGVGSLGALLERDAAAGGWRVVHVYASDPDIPEELAPLAQPGVDVKEGDIITAIDGVGTLSVPDPAELLRNKVGKQVLLQVRTAPGGGAGRAGSPPQTRSGTSSGGAMAERDVIVTPISLGRESDLRYDEWEYTRRLAVDQLGQGRLGYVHLRAMGSSNIAEWEREYYPVFNREGLIIDVRHNRGGNIDSWLLGKLLRRPWFYWKPRVGEAYWNMPYSFRGPMVVLIDEETASDGEAFAEGFRRLGLGKLIGTRTWGGEVWLSSSNFLADRGIATAAEQGVFGLDGKWLIEGWGVEPDIVVDNLPHATFNGGDAQLQAAVKYLLQEIDRKPLTAPPIPPYPKKGGRTGGSGIR